MRACGSCTLCCTLLVVQDISKPARSVCLHETAEGCEIYETRPWSCRSFNCLWLKGELPEWARPDKVGVIFDEAKPRIVGKVMPLLLIEEIPQAHEKDELQSLIRRLGEGRKIYAVGQDNTPRLIGWPDDSDRA